MIVLYVFSPIIILLLVQLGYLIIEIIKDIRDDFKK